MADSEQIRFMEVDGTIVFFNEAEAVCDLDAPEPDGPGIESTQKEKTAREKAADIAGLTVKRIDHYLKEEELTAEFVKTDGNSFRMPFPDVISSFRPVS